MKHAPNFTWLTLLALVLVLSAAAGARSWYLIECCDQGRLDSALQVQGEYRRAPLPDRAKYRSRSQPTEFDQLVENETKFQEFKCVPPLSDKDELTAHLAPGYPWLFGTIAHFEEETAEQIMRWLQCVLGSLTAGCYFFFARRAFRSTLVATVAGLLAAFHPFWVVNTAELNDGVLATFLLSASLMFGARGGQSGGPVAGLFFGLFLAALCLTRAAMLPFAVMGLLWFLWQCRRFSLGWFAAVLALLGFVNGLAPWGVRNYHLYDRPVPVVTSAYYHLWLGNNPGATGSTLDETASRAVLPSERLKELADEPNQAKRYDSLAHEVWQEIIHHPAKTISRRIEAALAFLFGERWFKAKQFAATREATEEVADMPEELRRRAETILAASLLALFVLAGLGWRWSFNWRVYGRLGTIAALLIPVPYLLGHAESLSGPRLPYDGVLLCYAAFALMSFLPGVVRKPEDKAEPAAKPAKGK